MKRGNIKRGQVWIETVIYTLMALTIIGIVLGLVRPALEERKDNLAIKESISVLNEIDSIFGDIKYTPGNSRSLEMKITRGNLIVDSIADNVKVIIQDSKYAPTEPGLAVSEGNIIEFTNLTKSKNYFVTLTLNYSGKFNITYQGKDDVKTFQPAPVPYNLIIKNNGGTVYQIDFY